MESFNPTFNYYADSIKAVVPKGVCTMHQMFKGIQNPKPKTQLVLEQIRHYSTLKDEAMRMRYKSMLPFFTPAVKCTYRNYKNIEHFTGLAPLDFDKLESVDYAKDFKQFLFEEYPQIIAVWLSASKRGVRALLRIPICATVEQYKQYYKGFAQNEGAKYNGLDLAPQNAVLPLFISHDPDILIRESAQVWNKKYIEPKPVKRERLSFYETNDRNKKRIYGLMEYKFNRIIDNGHPQLRALAYALGGFVGFGYLSTMEAEEMIIPLIRQNAYLGNPEKVDGYIKTAITMINKGMNEPCELENK